MNKNILLLLGSIIFSLLFFKQDVGLNFLLFSLTTVTLLCLFNAKKFKNKKVLLAGFLYLIMALFVFIYNSTLSIFTSVIAFFYLLCGALRLARFNANIAKVPSNYFQGLPIPGAALAIIGFIMVTIEFNLGAYRSYYAGVYVVFYSLLMVSNIPFNSFKNSDYVRKNRKKVLALILVIFALVFVYEQLMIFVVISAYVLGCMVYNIFNKETKVELFDWEDNEDEDQSE